MKNAKKSKGNATELLNVFPKMRFMNELVINLIDFAGIAYAGGGGGGWCVSEPAEICVLPFFARTFGSAPSPKLNYANAIGTLVLISHLW